MVTNKKYIDQSEESISKYLKEVRKTKTLTPEEEVVITKKIFEGDDSQIELLVKANLRFSFVIQTEILLPCI